MDLGGFRCFLNSRCVEDGSFSGRGFWGFSWTEVKVRRWFSLKWKHCSNNSRCNNHFPAHEILLNSKSNVQQFYERFLFVNFKKPVHKRSKQEKIMNPSSASKLMIRTQTSKQKSLDLPKTLDHPNPLHQFLHKNSNTPEKYPAWDEFHRRIFYVKNKKYHCSFCPNDGGQSFIRRDKDSCKCEYKNWKLGDQYVIKAAEWIACIL